MDSNIRVIARVKPLSAAESVEGKCLHVSSRRDITLNSNNSLFATRRFKLNCVLDEEASQDDVFQSIGPLLNNFMTGYNCTVFMYGQTGSGKTHTMLGYDLWNMVEKSPGTPTFATDESLLGIIPKSMQWLFAELSTNSFISEVLVSYIELYNDVKLFDLLSPSASESQQLDIREAKHGEIIIPGLTRLKVSSIADVLDALWSGAKFRHVAATDMNDYSSRSHTVFTVYLSIRNSAEGVQSKLNLVDLAGSEKWKSSQLAALSAERVKELTCINRSLSALGNCVSALMRKNRSHIPYRDAKLTRLLQDSLGGNTLTLFVVTISASIRNVEETASTLQFADRAMKVQVLVTKNSISSNETVDHLKLEIKNLKMLLHSVLAKSGSSDSSSATNIGVGNSSDIIESLNGEVQSLRDENISVLQMLKAAQEQLQSSQEENIRLLEILGSKKFEYSASLKDPLKSKKSQSNLINQFPDEIKLSILQARSEELEHRLQAAENIEAIQEERWGLLLNYHNWLQRQVADNTTGSEFGVAASDVYKRVELMEGSILVQADELRRAKKNFLQVSILQHFLQL